ncbi:MAG: hypothetical protein ACKOAX_07600, partial [Candidatus Kapaibacterium sp.]
MWSSGVNASPLRLTALCLVALAVGWLARGLRSGNGSTEPGTDIIRRQAVSCRRTPRADDRSSA